MKRAAAVLTSAMVALALAGCQTLRREKPKPVEAQPPPVPVLILPKPVSPPPPPPPPPPPQKSCVPKALPGAPRYPDTDAALRSAPGAADRYQLLAAGRIMRQERLSDLERAIAACR